MSLAPSASTLTKYKPGSLKEVWALTWPLMLSYFSLSLMLFTDRSFLAKMDANALHAGLKTSFVYFLIAMIPMAIAGVSEVIVGKLNGAGLHMKIGGVFWACLSLAAAVLPLALFAGLYVTDFLFDPSGLEAQYFRPLILFLPFQILTVALSGWYIGMGYVRVITYSTAAGACVNIFLDWALIFGNCGFPQMGITGAAIGTGLSLAFQSLCLLFLALGSAKYYAPYCTRLIKGSFKDIKAYLKEFCTIGFAPGLGQWFEILGQNCFFFLITHVTQQVEIRGYSIL